MSNFSSIRKAPALNNRLLILFDGGCGFCNRAVRWLIRHDSRDRLRFTPNQRYTQFAGANSLIVLLADGSHLRASNAILAALSQLPQPWPLLSAALRLIPLSLRDAAYRLIARNRHRLGLQLNTCPLPTKAEQRHFL